MLLKSNINPLKYMDNIPDYFLSRITDITHIDIPDNIKYIGQGAFYGCSSLTNIIIPKKDISD